MFIVTDTKFDTKETHNTINDKKFTNGFGLILICLEEDLVREVEEFRVTLKYKKGTTLIEI